MLNTQSPRGSNSSLLILSTSLVARAGETSLEEDSGWMMDGSIMFEGRGGGGGRMAISFACHALFEGGAKILVVAFPFRAP